MGNVRPSWDETFLSICDVMASRSPDPVTKLGCVVVGPDKEVRAMGYNGLPRGVRILPGRLQRPEKYLWMCHAERNAMDNAARVGVSLKGCTAYVQGVPCHECARGLIQVGVVKVVVRGSQVPEKWKESCERSLEMLREVGIMVSYPDSSAFVRLMTGEKWA